MTRNQDKRNKNLGYDANKQYKTRLRNNVISLIYGIITLAFICVMVLLEVMPKTYDVAVGEAAKETVYAIAEIEDSEKTSEARQAAMDKVADVFAVSDEDTEKIKNFFENTVFAGFKEVSEYGYSVRSEGAADGYQVAYDTEKVREYGEKQLSFLNKSQETKTSEEKVKKIMDSDPSDVENLKQWFMPVLEGQLRSGITPSDIETVKTALAGEVEASAATSNAGLKSVLAEVITDSLTPNYVLDGAATEKAKTSAANKVETVYIKKGTAVVTKDEIVTQAQYDTLYRLGMLSEGGISYRLVFGTGMLVLILVSLVTFYLVFFEKKTVAQPKKILLLSLLCIVDILVSLVFKSAGWANMMNTAMCVVLISVFFNENLALVVNTALSVVLSLIISKESDLFGIDSIALMISAYAGGTAAVFICKFVRVASRAKMLLPGAASGLVSMIAEFTVLMLAGKSAEYSSVAALYCLAGGIVASLLSTGSISIWESAFNLLTQSKLLELSSTGSELLRRMSIEVPGTYQHSTAVAELAENAAKDIGANAMLARAGALYHDIGKLRMPECYTENQTPDSKNFHSTLSPRESADMIFSHITEGVQMAKANKLPAEIIDIIKQHHGTSAVMYFYNKAKETDPNTDINDFRYPGPNPQTKEAGIILLADGIEASVRSMDEKSTESIRAQIEKMCKMRMEDGELDDCDLSLKDINAIKHSFALTLAAMYHTRIKYDDNGEKKDDGGNN